MENKIYVLPELPYAYGALAPHISEEQLKIHHQKHHQAYVNGANALSLALAQARQTNTTYDPKAVAKEMSFQVGGHILHSLFWKNLQPAPTQKPTPMGELAKAIIEQFGTYDRFVQEFSGLAATVEGSGWASLVYCRETGQLLLNQIEKHNANIIPSSPILLVLDVFEHAYYLDYKNERAKFIAAFWKIVNWEEANNRFIATLRQ
jgi:Fe-Mn family superoxide dismutase